MTNLMRVLVVLTLVGFFILAGSYSAAQAEAIHFSLAVGQGVTMGQYTLVFRGVSGGLPAYELYSGSALAARFPSTAAPLNPAEYSYGNGSISIATTGAAPDGTAVSGILTVR